MESDHVKVDSSGRGKGVALVVIGCVVIVAGLFIPSQFKSLPLVHILDPRIVVAEVKEATVAFMGVDVYSLANEPFKFEEAILVDRDGNYYGEIVFKLDAETPGYVKMESKIFSRIFGEFSPSRGDLVFSKTGDLLGILVNNNYCAMIDDLLTVGEVIFGVQIGDQKTSKALNAMKSRLNRLPPQLQ